MHTEKRRFSGWLPALLLALGGLAVVLPAGAEEVAATEEAAADREAELQARRQKMIEECKANRGVDCETEVDTELEAEQMGGGNAIVYPARPRPIVPRPRPRPH